MNTILTIKSRNAARRRRVDGYPLPDDGKRRARPFDNLPEGLQQSERGQEMEETAANLQEWAETISDIVGELWEIIEQ